MKNKKIIVGISALVIILVLVFFTIILTTRKSSSSSGYFKKDNKIEYSTQKNILLSAQANHIRKHLFHQPQKIQL